MKKITKIVTSLIAIVIVTNLHSQNEDIAYPHIIPMTPNASELAKYADYPVSYYTGTPNTSIPIYEINVDGFKLPISLNYHASGIRVDQEATWVGLGWSLDVGGRISRTINGADDFMMTPDRGYPFMLTGYYDAPDIDSNLINHYGQQGSTECNYWPLGCPEYQLFYDPEPDIFFYNLPNMNGKFLIDKSRGAVLFDKSHNLKVEVIRNGLGSTVQFKITDSEGNQYQYNQWETTKNYSVVGWLNQNIHSSNSVYDTSASSFNNWFNIRGDQGSDGGSSGMGPPTNVTSWCLTKVITSKGREIDFTYDSETQHLPTQESRENYRYGTPIGSNNYSDSQYSYKSKVVNEGLRLNKIEGDFGKIEFNCSSRLDLKTTAKKLDSIAIYNNKNDLIKSYRFNYSYFNNDYSGDIQYEHVFKRLKLNSLIEYVGNNPLNNGYVFDYFAGNFPPKNSKNVDYWGYQNGKNYGSNYCIGLRINNDLTFDGVVKDADFDKAIIGTLKRITYPTGGFAEFKFESNKMPSGYFETHTYDPLSTQNSTIVDLPVFNSISNASYEYPSQDTHTFVINNPTTIKISCDLENTNGTPDLNYDYNSTSNPLGRLRKISPTSSTIYSYVCPYVFGTSYSISNQIYGQGEEVTLTEQEFTLDAGTYEFIAYTPPKDVLAYWRFLIQENFYITPGATYNAGGIRISEIKTDAKTRKFNYPIGQMLVEPILYYKGIRFGIPNEAIDNCLVQVSESKTPLSTFSNGNFIGYDWVEEYVVDENNNVSKTKYTFFNDTESDFFDDNFPDSPRYINYKNGMIKYIDKYKNSTLLERNEINYSSTYSSIVKAFKDKGPANGPNGVIGVGPSVIVARKILQYNYQIEWPLKSNEINTLHFDNGQSIVSETNYSYNSRDLLQSTSSTVNNSLLVKELKYPFEFTDAISLSMVDKNMVGIPVKTETFRDNEKTSTKVTQYKDWGNGLLAPEIVKTSKGAITTEDRLIFNAYDENGNILEVQQESGIKITYIWGYNKTLPIAKIENATYTEVQQYEANLQTLSNGTDEASLIAALNNLRTSLPNAIITTYTYKPLVGISTVTDPTGNKITYHYDSFNRLEFVKDQYGNDLNKNEYHYKN